MNAEIDDSRQLKLGRRHGLTGEMIVIGAVAVLAGYIGGRFGDVSAAGQMFALAATVGLCILIGVAMIRLLGLVQVTETRRRTAARATASLQRSRSAIEEKYGAIGDDEELHAAGRELLQRVAFPEAASDEKATRQKPAVPISESVTDDYIVSLEDGRKFKSLKRHLRTQYGLTPDQYREKWGLPPDYPMVAPSYSVARARVTKKAAASRKPGRAAASKK